MWGTGFGGIVSYETMKTTAFINATSGYQSIGDLCSPGQTCFPGYYRCLTNVDVTGFVQSALGGSLSIQTFTSGVLTVSPNCLYKENVLYVKLTLSALYGQPTFSPSFAPTTPMQATGLDSLNKLVTSGNTPIYLIFMFGIFYAFMGAYFCRLRTTQKTIVHLPFFTTVAQMSLLGSGLISEMYLVNFLWDGQYKYLGILILVSRLLHALPTAYVFLSIIGPNAYSAYFVNMLNMDHLLSKSKAYGALGFMSVLEVSLLRYLPWRDTLFAERSGGYPSMFMLRLLSSTKLTQSIITVACQFTFLIQVNDKFMAETTSSALVFLYLNMSTTIAGVYFYLFEFLLIIFSRWFLSIYYYR